MFDHVRTHQPPAGCHLYVKEIERTGKNEEMAKKVAFFQKAPRIFFQNQFLNVHIEPVSLVHQTYWEIFDLKFDPLHCGPQLIFLKKFSFFMTHAD